MRGFILHTIGSQTRKEKVREYAKIRTTASTEEKLELDMIEASYDFDISTGIVLMLIGIYYLAYGEIKYLVIPILTFSVILFAGGFFELRESYWPYLDALRGRKKETS